MEMKSAEPLANLNMETLGNPKSGIGRAGCGKSGGEGHMGLYLLSFLLIHKYFKAFLTHKAEKRKQRNRKRGRASARAAALEKKVERWEEREREGGTTFNEYIKTIKIP